LRPHDLRPKPRPQSIFHSFPSTPRPRSVVDSVNDEDEEEWARDTTTEVREGWSAKWEEIKYRVERGSRGFRKVCKRIGQFVSRMLSTEIRMRTDEGVVDDCPPLGSIDESVRRVCTAPPSRTQRGRAFESVRPLRFPPDTITNVIFAARSKWQETVPSPSRSSPSAPTSTDLPLPTPHPSDCLPPSLPPSSRASTPSGAEK
jgi:hypothetical protein